MKHITNTTLTLVVLSLALITLQEAQGLYFFLSEGQIKCFKDELVKNSVS